MAKTKRNYRSNRKYKVKKATQKDLKQEVLEDMLNCQTTCVDLGTVEIKKGDFTTAEIDELLKELPGVDYVLDRMINYLFSNGLTTGNPEVDEATLDPWLYEKKNRSGAVNYEVLKETIRQAIAFGECGLRLYDGALYSYKSGTYGIILNREDGIEEVVAYFVREDGKAIEKDVDKEDWDSMETYGAINRFFEDNGYILLDKTEFENIRNNPGYLHGYSPFTRDQQRLDLLLSIYDRMNYDIVYDGPGRIILRPKSGYIAGDGNEVSTSQIIDNSMGAQIKRNEDAKKEVKRVAKEIKDSSSDSVILLSNAFDDNIEHLPRVTKSTEFFDWVGNDTVIVAQILGMSPTLLEVGKLHGNVSVEKIIDNAMLNTIIPQRENYAVQFSKMVSNYLNIEKVYFNKYDLEQVQDENDIREKIAQTIQKLSYANRSTPSANIEKLINEFTDYLRTSIYDNKSNIRTL